MNNLETIFLHARALTDSAQRAAYLA